MNMTAAMINASRRGCSDAGEPGSIGLVVYPAALTRAGKPHTLRRGGPRPESLQETIMPRISMPAAMFVAGLTAGGAALAAGAGTPRLAVTIYSSAQPGGIPAEWYRPLPGMGTPVATQLPGYAMVRDERAVHLDRSRTLLRIDDVAALIDPTTVQFQSLTDPAGTRVLEQDFQFDLVSTQKLLSRFIDREVAVERQQGQQGQQASELRGTLLSANDGLVLKAADGQIHALNQWQNLRFGELPGGLITKPTLLWDVAAKKPGEHRARVSYQTGGITWWADYNLTWSEGADANSGFVNLGAWVSILNQSGAAYPEAKLKLVAGDVHRAQPPRPSRAMVMKAEAMAMDAAAPGFEEKAFFEYHLYTLQRPTTIPNNATKQIELFDAASRVPAKKVMVYDGAAGVGVFGSPMLEREFAPQSNTKVDVWLRFRNDPASGLGMPLPAGRIRVAQLDSADDTLEFIGEDVIDHTPKNEDVRVKLGTAFDVVGERRQTDFRVDTRARWMEEAFEIRVRNHKDQPVEVQVRERLYRWNTWKMLESSAPYEKKDAATVEFPVKVAKDGEAVVSYRVRYAW